MKNRKRPERTCIICRRKLDKRELNRIVLNKEEELFYDPTGKANGRGAYLCNDSECVNKFFTKNFLNKAFKREISTEQINNVKESLKENLKIQAVSEDKP